MKNLIGVMIITSVIAVGLYYYLNSTEPEIIQQSEKVAPASISEPLAEEKSVQESEPEEKVPDLESLEGLEEESNNVFDGPEGLPQETSSGPSEDGTQ